jgi:hypothetical protein
MARSPRSTPEPDPDLAVPSAKLVDQLQVRIAEGESLGAQSVATRDEHRARNDAFKSWDSYNTTLLRRAFTSTSIGDKYTYKPGPSLGVELPIAKESEFLTNRIQRQVQQLLSIAQQVDDGLYGHGPASTPSTEVRPADIVDGDHVFLVHGRDHRVQGVARHIEKAGGKVTILQETTLNGASTTIERLEDQAAHACHAVVIFTGDDEGRLAGDEDLHRRARQNVVAELGYFVGNLGRRHVTVLSERGVEIPSNFSGVGYIELDEGGAWRAKLLDELRDAKVSGIR